MRKNLIAKCEVTIKAPINKVWEALIKPELIKQYLFGTEVISDWMVGSSIAYKGVWEGKSYEDKGKILQIIPEKILKSTYWSSMAGTPDKPENYATVTYKLREKDGKTELILTQDNNTSDDSRRHSEQNWNMVLGKLKELLEK